MRVWGNQVLVAEEPADAVIWLRRRFVGRGRLGLLCAVCAITAMLYSREGELALSVLAAERQGFDMFAGISVTLLNRSNHHPILSQQPSQRGGTLVLHAHRSDRASVQRRFPFPVCIFPSLRQHFSTRAACLYLRIHQLIYGCATPSEQSFARVSVPSSLSGLQRLSMGRLSYRTCSCIG